MNTYHLIIIAAIISWAMAIISLVAQVRTWQILKEISSSLGSFSEVEKGHAKKEAREIIDTAYIPKGDAEKAETLIQFLSSLTDDKEAKLLVKDLKDLEVV